MLDLENYLEETSKDPKKIVTLAKLIDNIQNSRVTSLNLNPGLLQLINIHTEANNLDKFKLNEALKNKIWF
jgi:methylthioribose-1-phosphate isomerase